MPDKSVFLSDREGNAVVRLLEYCLKMGAVASSVKMSDGVMQKAFGL